MILVSLDDVRAGMALGVPLQNAEGHTLLGPGVVLTNEYRARIQRLGYLAIWIDDEDTRDIAYEETLSETTRRGATAVLEHVVALAARETTRAGTVSAAGIRTMLEGRRFHQAFRDSGTPERLAGALDRVLKEVLTGAPLTGLGSLRLRDKNLADHCLDVAVTAALIGQILGYDHATLRRLALGCLLHDLGEVFVGGRAAERSGTHADPGHRDDHPFFGYLFLRETLGLSAVSAHIAYQHHERQDGRGYPRGLTGTNRLVDGAEVPGRIHRLAEIAAIADVYDQSSAERPHGSRRAADEVWEQVAAAAGVHLNEEIVRRFLGVLPPYPLGTRIAVKAGRYLDHTGVVARLFSDAPARPLVRLLADATGARIAPVDLDLRKEDAEVRGVVEQHAVAR